MHYWFTLPELTNDEKQPFRVAKYTLTGIANMFYYLGHWLFSQQYLVISQALTRVGNNNAPQYKTAFTVINAVVCVSIFTNWAVYIYVNDAWSANGG